MKFSFALVLTLGIVVAALAADPPATPAADPPATPAATPETPVFATTKASAPEIPAVAPSKPSPAEIPIGSCDSARKPAGQYYKDENSGKGLFGAWNCMKYYECVLGQEIEHHCSYFIPLRQYNPQTRTCEWFWRARCQQDDPIN